MQTNSDHNIQIQPNRSCSKINMIKRALPIPKPSLLISDWIEWTRWSHPQIVAPDLRFFCCFLFYPPPREKKNQEKSSLRIPLGRLRAIPPRVETFMNSPTEQDSALFPKPRYNTNFHEWRNQYNKNVPVLGGLTTQSQAAIPLRPHCT